MLPGDTWAVIYNFMAALISAPSFTDPNAQAANNAGRGLANLANFIYQQQVTKPEVQAQTAQTQAQTGFLQGPQTEQLRQQITAAQLQNQMAKLAAAHQTLTFAPEAPSFGTQTTDTSTQANAPQVRSTPSVTGAAGGGDAGPAPSGSQLPPVDNTPAGGAINMAGSSRQGPDTISTKFPPISNDELSPSLTQPGKSVFRVSSPAGTPGQPGSTATPPGPSATSPVPPAVSPSAQKEPLDLSQYIGKPFDSLTPNVQQEVIARGRQHFVNAGVPGGISDPEIVGHWNAQQAQTINPLALKGGMTPVSGEVNGIKYVNSAALNGEGSGTGQILYDAYGNPHENKNFGAPAQVQSDEEDAGNLNRAQAMLDQAKDALKNNPKLVGSSPGVAVSDKWREGKALVGAPEALTQQNALDRFGAGEFLNILGSVHIGRVTQQEANQFQKEGITRSGHTAADWDRYFQSAQKAIDTRQNAVKEKLQKEGGTLPPISLSPSVSAPATGELTREQAQVVPVGKPFRFNGGTYVRGADGKFQAASQ